MRHGRKVARDDQGCTRLLQQKVKPAPNVFRAHFVFWGHSIATATNGKEASSSIGSCNMRSTLAPSQEVRRGSKIALAFCTPSRRGAKKMLSSFHGICPTHIVFVDSKARAHASNQLKTKTRMETRLLHVRCDHLALEDTQKACDTIRKMLQI